MVLGRRLSSASSRFTPFVPMSKEILMDSFRGLSCLLALGGLAIGRSGKKLESEKKERQDTYVSGFLLAYPGVMP